jgi:DNA-binding response OmpR family regulator
VSDLVFLHNRIDACSFISQIRSQPQFDLTSIIVVSGYIREEDREQARRCGADLFCIKPCLPQTLLDHVERALVSHRRGSRLKGHWTSRAFDRRHVSRAADRDRRRHQPGTRPPF